MPLISNLRYHDYQFELPVSSGKWKWVTRLDVSQSNPAFYIRDVISPYGLLRDSIPIPGEVVQSMAQSIQDLKDNFKPHILVGPPTSLTFLVDEGRGTSLPQTLILTNDGVYGSLLGMSLTPSAAYVRVTPGSVGNLAFNESGQISVDVNSTSLISENSPYAESVTIQDSTATNSPRNLPITIVVRPKATIRVTPSLLFTFTVAKPLTGDFPAIPAQTFNVANIGPTGSVLDYTVKKLLGLSDWLPSFLPSSGTLTTVTSDTVTVTVAPASTLLVGTYTEKLRVAGYSSNSYIDVEIRLVIV